MYTLEELQSMVLEIEKNYLKKKLLKKFSKGETIKLKEFELKLQDDETWSLISCPYISDDSKILIILPLFCSSFDIIFSLSSFLPKCQNNIEIRGGSKHSMNLGGLFKRTSVEKVNLSNLNATELYLQSTFEGSALKEFQLKKGVVLKSCKSTFKNCRYLESIDLSDYIFSDDCVLSNILSNCVNLKEIIAFKKLFYCLNIHRLDSLENIKLCDSNQNTLYSLKNCEIRINIDSKKSIIFTNGSDCFVSDTNSKILKDVVELWYGGIQVGTRLVLSSLSDYPCIYGSLDSVYITICYDSDEIRKGSKKEELKLITVTRKGKEYDCLVSKVEYENKIRFTHISKEEFLMYYSPIEKYI